MLFFVSFFVQSQKVCFFLVLFFCFFVRGEKFHCDYRCWDHTQLTENLGHFVDAN